MLVALGRPGVYAVFGFVRTAVLAAFLNSGEAPDFSTRSAVDSRTTLGPDLPMRGPRAGCAEVLLEFSRCVICLSCSGTVS
jgi:hypothetical protein